MNKIHCLFKAIECLTNDCSKSFFMEMKTPVAAPRTMDTTNVIASPTSWQGFHSFCCQIWIQGFGKPALTPVFQESVHHRQQWQGSPPSASSGYASPTIGKVTWLVDANWPRLVHNRGKSCTVLRHMSPPWKMWEWRTSLRNVWILGQFGRARAGRLTRPS